MGRLDPHTLPHWDRQLLSLFFSFLLFFFYCFRICATFLFFSPPRLTACLYDVCVLVEAFVSITVKKKRKKDTNGGRERRKKALGSMNTSLFPFFCFSLFHPKRTVVFFFSSTLLRMSFSRGVCPVAHSPRLRKWQHCAGGGGSTEIENKWASSIPDWLFPLQFTRA